MITCVHIYPLNSVSIKIKKSIWTMKWSSAGKKDAFNNWNIFNAFQFMSTLQPNENNKKCNYNGNKLLKEMITLETKKNYE